MSRLGAALQPWRRIALHRIGGAGSLGGVDEVQASLPRGLSSVAEKQQARDVREGELNFD
jgi:hypothetical protein